MAIDELVERIRLYNQKQVWLHGYFAPFLLAYVVTFYLWLFRYGFYAYFEEFCMILALLGVLQTIAVLLCIWFISIRCFLTCSQVRDPCKATLAMVTPTPNNGSAELVPLHKVDGDGHYKIWLEFQKSKYILDPAERKDFSAIEFPDHLEFAHYQKSVGHSDPSSFSAALEHYGANSMQMVIPSFMELFWERATAPFFVFQMFCILLWCMDEFWYYSLFTSALLVTFEATLVQHQLRNMQEIRKMGNAPYLINAYRNMKWVKVSTEELVAGDIISIGEKSCPIPCDILLLRGPCIVDESLLTGESVPQMKVQNLLKLSILITRWIWIIRPELKVYREGDFSAPDNGCIGYVLRTGFSTSQGRLLRTILYGVKRITANNRETFFFILFLLVFALCAALYVWMKEDAERSRYKLLLECALILTSVIPPELPIELSLAVNHSLISLHKLGIFCTEPFRVPFAGKVDICCFDKTGTLTTDNLVCVGVHSDEIVPLQEAPQESIRVLVTCHSLVQLETELIGDPLEKACLAGSEWILTRQDTVIPSKSKQVPLHICHRYHFSSSLQRMSVIASYVPTGTSDMMYFVAVKGSPEVLKPRFVNAPENYDEVYESMTLEGARVLALVSASALREIRDMTRDEVENGLDFVGFVIISCPLKPDSKAVVETIQHSGHKVVSIITGDNPLTACHVAKELLNWHCRLPHTDDFTTSGIDWCWRSLDKSIQVPMVPIQGAKYLTDNFHLCLTGAFMNTNMAFLLELVPHVKVFARMAPKQKELIIVMLKRQGIVTLMCGDGTNDVGALKHADVGVALLSHPMPKERKGATSKSIDVKGAENPSASKSDKFMPSNAAKRPPHAVLRKAVRMSQGKLQEILKNIEEENPSFVRLGDASVAAPFTSKYSSIQSICHVIRHGRCTLVTTLQMFKILALNALVQAYSQSVLYLDGIKFSDTQATVQGLLLVACFFFISRSKPLHKLAKQRPLPNIFNVYTLLTVSLQFAVHFFSLVYLVKMAHNVDRVEKPAKIDDKFSPNLVNTTVYLMSVFLQTCNFAVNYHGHPFMESLMENKSLLYSLLLSGGIVVTIAAGFMPEMVTSFELVPLPAEVKAFRRTVLMAIGLDLIGCYFIDKLCALLFGEVRSAAK
ncbi:cation transporting ATPase 13A1 [Trichuris trichiura]|uniref:Cation transporting ATPase 13A1 n=1 Tax=Trichuris trichiura TaxID=36087 RepID=A0A077YYV6_TRITR|nr:cation transporting ATPase 13A1 [Trichuris trichiura]